MWYVIQTLKGQENKTANEVISYVAESDENVFVFEFVAALLFGIL